MCRQRATAALVRRRGRGRLSALWRELPLVARKRPKPVAFAESTGWRQDRLPLDPRIAPPHALCALLQPARRAAAPSRGACTSAQPPCCKLARSALGATDASLPPHVINANGSPTRAARHARTRGAVTGVGTASTLAGAASPSLEAKAIAPAYRARGRDLSPVA